MLSKTGRIEIQPKSLSVNRFYDRCEKLESLGFPAIASAAAYQLSVFIF
jgi:hypothetical protein